MPTWFDVAMSYRGLREVRGKLHNPTIVGWLRDFGRNIGRWGQSRDETPWCAVFVSHCLEAAGLNPDAAGENWVYVSRSSSQAVRYAIDWFMNSTPHRRNILQERYTRLGVGVARAREGGQIFVLTFAGKELD